MLRTLDLEGCADTLVGNHMLRGISGGCAVQEQPLTPGTAMLPPAPCCR